MKNNDHAWVGFCQHVSQRKPKPPMSLEALLVAHADSCDAMFGTYCRVIEKDDMPGEITSRKTILGYALFKKGG